MQVPRPSSDHGSVAGAAGVRDETTATHQLWNLVAAYDAVDPTGPIDATDPQDTSFSREFRRHYAKRTLRDLEAMQSTRTKRECIRSVSTAYVSRCNVAHPDACVAAVCSAAFRRLYATPVLGSETSERIDASLKKMMARLPFARESNMDALLSAFYRASQACVDDLPEVKAIGEDEADLALWLASVDDPEFGATATVL